MILQKNSIDCPMVQNGGLGEEFKKKKRIRFTRFTSDVFFFLVFSVFFFVSFFLR